MSPRPRAKVIAPERWSRPEPAATGPDRSFGGYYRTSDRKVRGKDFRGVPLQAAEDVAVAAVRMGYRVVDAQIERGLDMARRLRGAADRAGIGDTSATFDKGENLLNRGVMMGLEWLEAAANQPGSPLRRLLMAEYKMMGALFGLGSEQGPAPPQAQPAPAAGRTAPRAAAAAETTVRIRHGQDSTKRAVTIARWDLNRPPVSVPADYPLTFHLTSGKTGDYLKGFVRLAPKGGTTLEVVTTDEQPPGRWRAAVCQPDGEQVGIVEIDL